MGPSSSVYEAKWKGLPRSEERFAGRMSNAERISYYYGAPGKPLVCVTCGSKELVLALPPLCATCLKRASVVEILKRLPLLDGTRSSVRSGRACRVAKSALLAGCLMRSGYPTTRCPRQAIGLRHLWLEGAGAGPAPAMRHVPEKG